MKKFLLAGLLALSTLVGAQTPQGNRVAWTDTTKIAKGGQFVNVQSLFEVADTTTLDDLTADAVGNRITLVNRGAGSPYSKRELVYVSNAEMSNRWGYNTFDGNFIHKSGSVSHRWVDAELYEFGRCNVLAAGALPDSNLTSSTGIENNIAFMKSREMAENLLNVNTVYIPNGYYLFDRDASGQGGDFSLRTFPNMKLIGESSLGTWIVAADSNTASFITVDNHSMRQVPLKDRNVHIEGIRLVGKTAFQAVDATRSSGAGAGIHIQPNSTHADSILNRVFIRDVETRLIRKEAVKAVIAKEVIFENVRAYNGNFVPFTISAKHVTMRDCVADTFFAGAELAANPYLTDDSLTTMILVNNQLMNGYSYGMKLNSGRNVLVAGNYIQGRADVVVNNGDANGIDLVALSTQNGHGLGNVTITNNVFRDIEYHDIRLGGTGDSDATGNLLISNNQSKNAYVSNVHIDAFSSSQDNVGNVKINDNLFEDANRGNDGAVTSRPIVIQHADSVHISNNVIRNGIYDTYTKASPIYLDNADHTYIVDNDFRGGHTSGGGVISANTTIDLYVYGNVGLSKTSALQWNSVGYAQGFYVDTAGNVKLGDEQYTGYSAPDGYVNALTAATGDGTTDDATAIQAMENWGYDMYFPGGYTFLMKSGIVVDGDNRKMFIDNNSVIKFDTTGASTPNVRLFDVRVDTFEVFGGGRMQGSWNWVASTNSSRLFGTASSSGNCAFFIYPQHTNGSRLKRVRIDGITFKGWGYAAILSDDLLAPGTNTIEEIDITNNVFDNNAQHIFWDQSDGTVQDVKHTEISSNWFGRTNGPDTSTTYTNQMYTDVKGNHIWFAVGSETVILENNYSELSGRYFVEIWPSSGGSLDDRCQYVIIRNNTTKNTVGQTYSIAGQYVHFDSNLQLDHTPFNTPELAGEEVRITNNRGYWKFGQSGYGANSADWLDVKYYEITGNTFYTDSKNKGWGDPMLNFPFGDKMSVVNNAFYIEDTLNADIWRLKNITNSRFVGNTIYMNTAKYRNTSNEAVILLSYSQNVTMEDNRIIFNTVPDTILEGMIWGQFGNDDVRWINNKTIVKAVDTVIVARAIAGEGALAATVKNEYTWNNGTGSWDLDSLAVNNEGFVRNAPVTSDSVNGYKTIVGDNPTGVFAGNARTVATYSGGSWSFSSVIKDFIQHQTFNGDISNGLNPLAQNAKGRLPLVGNSANDKIIAYDNQMTRNVFKGNDFGGSGKVFINGTTPGSTNYEFELLNSNGFAWNNEYHLDDEDGREYTFNGTINNTQTTLDAYKEISARDSFTTTATSDTVRIVGTTTSSVFEVTIIDATPVANDMLSYTTTADTLFVHRPAGTTSGLNYSWKRLEK